ncbi:MAG: cell division protein FtsQ [Marinilabiliaceae bacterium]|nr:cell division protein FtsQ [Marinilabiliaceae bacterium]
MKRIVKITLWTLAGVYVAGMIIFMMVRHNTLMCDHIRVVVLDSASVQFVSPGEISRHVHRHFKKLEGRLFKEINMEEVEAVVNKYPAVEKSDVYSTADGALMIKVKQRTPVLRVYDKGYTYLLDHEGVRIPMRGSYSKRLLVVNGNLHKVKDAKDLVALNDFIEGDSFWKAQIEQVYVASDGDLLLIPRVGSHRINIGNVTDLDRKFKKLLALYQDGLDPLEWNSYKEINLKYKGQIICTKL